MAVAGAGAGAGAEIMVKVGAKINNFGSATLITIKGNVQIYGGVRVSQFRF